MSVTKVVMHLDQYEEKIMEREIWISSIIILMTFSPGFFFFPHSSKTLWIPQGLRDYKDCPVWQNKSTFIE